MILHEVLVIQNFLSSGSFDQLNYTYKQMDLKTYEQSILDNTSWNLYGGKKDKNRRFLILGPFQKSKIGFAVTSVKNQNIKLPPTSLVLKKSEQEDLEMDSIAEFHHVSTYNFPNSKLNLKMNEKEVEKKLKMAIGLIGVKYVNEKIIYSRGKVFKNPKKDESWIIVSHDRANESKTESVVCLHRIF